MFIASQLGFSAARVEAPARVFVDGEFYLELGADASGFSLRVLESGWSITQVDDSHLHCSVTQPNDGTESTVDCSVNYDRIRSELRAIYDRGLGLSN